MKNFGFSISQTRSMNMDLVDKSILNELEESVPSFKRCMNCGACTATCSAQQFTNYNIRKIKSMCSMGQYEGLSEELKHCMLCGKCTLVCPRGVNLRATIIAMRKILMKHKTK